MPDMPDHDYARELRQALSGMFSVEGTSLGHWSRPAHQLRLANMCLRGEGGARDYRMAGSLFEALAGAGSNAYFAGLQHYCFWVFYTTGQGSSYWIGSPNNMRYDDAPHRRKAAKHAKRARKYLKKAAGWRPKAGVPGRSEWQIERAKFLLNEVSSSG